MCNDIFAPHKHTSTKFSDFQPLLIEFLHRLEVDDYSALAIPLLQEAKHIQNLIFVTLNA